jgi:cytochrome P450
MPSADPIVDIGPQEAVLALLSTTGRTNPYPYYDVLRTKAPVFPFGNFVILSRYADCAKVLRDPVFDVEHAAHMDQSFPGWRDHASVTLLRESMLFAPRPDHEWMRKAAAHAFTQRRVNELRDKVAALADKVADRLAVDGPVDFMAEFARRLPGTVAGELLGVPVSDRDWLRARVTDLSAILEAQPNEADIAAADAAAGELRSYVESRVDSPEGLISTLAEGGLDGALIPNLALILAAGFETTSNLLGNGLAALLDNPSVLADLRANPDLVSEYVEEMLRYDPPVHVASRWAEADTEIAGEPVSKGREAIVLLGAASRDPERFPDPGAFRPGRPDNQPLSFGAGPHFCLGAALARLQASVAFPLLLKRFPNMAAAGDRTRVDRLTTNGFAQLPVVTR